MHDRNKAAPISRRTSARRRSLVGALVSAMGFWAGIALPTQASASPALTQRYLCIACHQPVAKTAGPSWKDIGARYGEGKGTAAQLAASIKNGSAGKWGAMPMPAQAQVSDADAQAIAQWLIDGAK